MTDRFTEYREISVTDPLRQGDIIEATNPDAPKWKRHLLVITADCDFANAKHHGRVTCVPLLTQDEYLLEMQIPRVRERFVARMAGILHGILTSAEAPSISDRRLREWACEEEPTTIARALKIESSQVTTAVSALTAIRVASGSFASLDEAVNHLVEAQLVAPNPKKRENVVKDITASLKGHYAAPPGDALFLSTVGPKLETGYFAYLRHLEQVWEPEIALGPTHSEVLYRRIARLQDRFIHALAQRFALVFMSIGLPGEYEEIRDLHSELLGESFK